MYTEVAVANFEVDLLFLFSVPTSPVLCVAVSHCQSLLLQKWTQNQLTPSMSSRERERERERERCKNGYRLELAKLVTYFLVFLRVLRFLVEHMASTGSEKSENIDNSLSHLVYMY